MENRSLKLSEVTDFIDLSMKCIILKINDLHTQKRDVLVVA